MLYASLRIKGLAFIMPVIACLCFSSCSESNVLSIDDSLSDIVDRTDGNVQGVISIDIPHSDKKLSRVQAHIAFEDNHGVPKSNLLNDTYFDEATNTFMLSIIDDEIGRRHNWQAMLSTLGNIYTFSFTFLPPEAIIMQEPIASSNKEYTKVSRHHFGITWKPSGTDSVRIEIRYDPLINFPQQLSSHPSNLLPDSESVSITVPDTGVFLVPADELQKFKEGSILDVRIERTHYGITTNGTFRYAVAVARSHENRILLQ
jgi:hypothetical protein